MTVDEALARSIEVLWHDHISDNDARAVSKLFQINGFQWHLDELGTEGLYDKTNGLEYCGHTVAAAGLLIGDHAFDDRCEDARLDEELCSRVLPSKYRLSTAAKWEQAGYRRDDAAHEADAVKRGAICTLASRPHIFVALDDPNESGEFPTIEGNTFGTFPDGSKGKGVVRKTRNVYNVDTVYLLGPEHTQGRYVFEV